MRSMQAVTAPVRHVIKHTQPRATPSESMKQQQTHRSCKYSRNVLQTAICDDNKSKYTVTKRKASSLQYTSRAQAGFTTALIPLGRPCAKFVGRSQEH